MSSMRRIRFCLIGIAIGSMAMAPTWSGVPGTETYTYDALGRLVKIDSPDGTESTYNYDLAGNRQSINIGADVTPPSAPSNLTATAASSTTVNLSWTGSSDTGGSGLSGYAIYRNASTTALGLTAGTTYQDNTTVGTTAYTYNVKAYDGKGNFSAASNTASVTTPDTIPPSVPTGLTATAVSSSQINLSWNASTDTGGSLLKGYKITRNGTALTPTTTTATTYSDAGLAASTTYTYTVAAYDNSGNTSGASSPASATTTTLQGTFQLVSEGRTARGSMNEPAVVVIKNSGTGTITAITYSCAPGGNWHKTGTPPTSLAPGASGSFVCQATIANSSNVTFTFTGTTVTNSPFSPAPF